MDSKTDSMKNYEVIEYDVKASPEEVLELITNSIDEDMLSMVPEAVVAINVLTGSAGLEKILKAPNIERHEFFPKRFVVEAKEPYSIELEHLELLDSTYLETRMHRGYPLLSYKIIVLWVGDPILILKPKNK